MRQTEGAKRRRSVRHTSWALRTPIFTAYPGRPPCCGLLAGTSLLKDLAEVDELCLLPGSFLEERIKKTHARLKPSSGLQHQRSVQQTRARRTQAVLSGEARTEQLSETVQAKCWLAKGQTQERNSRNPSSWKAALDRRGSCSAKKSAQGYNIAIFPSLKHTLLVSYFF